MADPIYINPGFKPAPGGGEESLAASSAMIVSGMEKDLNIKKTDKVLEKEKIELKELDQYIQKLTETTHVESIRKREERKDGEKKEKLPEGKKGQKKGGKGSGAKPFEWAGRTIAPPKVIVLRAGDRDKFKRNVNVDVLKEYLTLHIKTSAKIPKEEFEKNRAALASIEAKLKGSRQDEFIHRTRAELDKIVVDEMSRMIRSALLRKLSTDEGFTDWIISSRRSGNILRYALYNEATEGLDSYSGSGLLGALLVNDASNKWNIKARAADELADIARELGLDLTSWVSSFIAEKVSFRGDGSIVIDRKLVEQEWQKSLLLDELKMLYVNLIMEEGLIKSFFVERRINRVVGWLLELNVSQEILRDARSTAKRIAWAKIITELKDVHLARVFTASESEFERNSKKIYALTKKARRIGAGISESGLKFVAAKLDLLALETANYKLELLRSMQTMEFDKEREREITWLIQTTGRLKETEERVVFWESIRKLASRFFK